MNADEADDIPPPAPATDGPRAPERLGRRDQGEISLRDVLIRIWRGKWTFVVTLAIVVGIVVLWMKLSHPRYTATMVLAPSSEGGAGGLAGKLSQYSGLAALAGIDLASGESVRPFSQFVETLSSPLVAERLQAEHEILPIVFAEKWAWNAERREWRRKGHLLTPIADLVRRFFDLPPAPVPSALALSEYLESELVITSVARTGMVKIAFDHRDPEFAVALLGWLHREGDAIIREEAEARTSSQIAYIERKLRTTTAADHRRSLIQLLLDEERQMMMIQVDLPFAARIIQPPTATDAPTFPRPPLFIAIAVVAGGFLGIFMIFLVDAVRGRRPSPSSRRRWLKRPGPGRPPAEGGDARDRAAPLGEAADRPRDTDPARAAE